MSKIKIGITQGDLNGIGIEVILKTFENDAMFDLCTPIVYGSVKGITYHRKGLNLNTNFTAIASAEVAVHGKLNIVNIGEDEIKIEYGAASTETGEAARMALERAVKEYKAGLIDTIVTAPINKAAINSANFPYNGHTEYFEAQFGEGGKSLMILMNSTLRVALVTTHIPVSQVPQYIVKETIKEKITILETSLRNDFGIARPRIAVLALNPHAGDGGLIGTEEQEHILPAINELSEEGSLVFGAYPADSFFGGADIDRFDAILAMYHDQGLAPFKALAGKDAVNYTAGLPLVRTSPAHGTAFDIAGKGEASPASFREAIYAAIDIVRVRKNEEMIARPPLQKYYIP